MVKIALSCAVMLVVCQLAAAFAVAPATNDNNEANIDCAQDLAITLRQYYTHLAGQAREKFHELREERERCETLTGTAGVVCWGRYRAQIVFIVSDLIEAFRNRQERFEDYAQVLLERYYACRTADDDVFAAIEEVLAEIKADEELVAVPLNDVQCATDLKDQVLEHYEEFAARLAERFRAARTIRRQCQLTTQQPALDRCWWSFRIQVLFGITDTIRDVQARRENFSRVTLELLEAYYQCRSQ